MTEHLREVIVESHIAFQGRLLTLRVDTVRLPDGHTSTREVVVHPGAVGIVPMLDHARSAASRPIPPRLRWPPARTRGPARRAS